MSLWCGQVYVGGEQVGTAELTFVRRRTDDFHILPFPYPLPYPQPVPLPQPMKDDVCAFKPAHGRRTKELVALGVPGG